MKTIGFIGAVSVICALLLSTAATGLKERQDRNEALDKKRNILKAFDVSMKTDAESGKERRLTADEIDEFFTAHVEVIAVDLEGNAYEDIDAAALEMRAEDKKAVKSERRYPVFKCTVGDDVAYSVPIIGRGLWSTLYGYFSVEADFNTVKGITFYKHGETPGLGAEIEQDWFQNNFKRKKIKDPEGKFVSIRVVKGDAQQKYGHDPEKLSHCVDGISGATITSKGVTAMLDEDLRLFLPYFETLEKP